jgi:hypothetical protein
VAVREIGEILGRTMAGLVMFVSSDGPELTMIKTAGESIAAGAADFASTATPRLGE